MEEQKARSVGEFVGEIRKGVRMYEAFKEAEKVATMLLEQETIARNIQASITEGRKMENELQSSLNELDKKIEVQLERHKVQEEQAQEWLRKVKQEGMDLVAQASMEAKRIIDYANADADSVKEHCSQLRKNKETLENEFKKETKKLDDLKKEVEAYKERISRIV